MVKWQLAITQPWAVWKPTRGSDANRQAPSLIAAVWRNITHKRDPFAYLGAVYLFDALTPIVTDEVKAHLTKRLGSTKGLAFIVHHATADKEHEAQIRMLIRDVATLYPRKIK